MSDADSIQETRRLESRVLRFFYDVRQRAEPPRTGAAQLNDAAADVLEMPLQTARRIALLLQDNGLLKGYTLQWGFIITPAGSRQIEAEIMQSAKESDDMPPRRSAQPPQPPDIRVFRTIDEIDTTITKLRRRVADVEKLRDDNVRHDEARVDNVEHLIRDTIREEFGKDSPECDRHRYFEIDDGPKYARSDWGGHDYDAEDRARFRAAIPGAITRVQGLIERLEEKRADLGAPLAAPRASFQGRTFHPDILRAAESLYLSTHYAQAVFEAGKALIALVKAKSGSTLDGAPLMQNVFSVNNPILKFNALADQSDRDEQQGMMQLYTGAVLAIRNPGGHRVGVAQRPERALQHLELLSYLADRLDETTK